MVGRDPARSHSRVQPTLWSATLRRTVFASSIVQGRALCAPLAQSQRDARLIVAINACDRTYSRKWAVWAPSVCDMASAGGDELIGWHINRGWAQQADFFPASQSGGKYKRPDIVRLELRTRDETEAMRHANRTPTMKEVAALSTRSGSSV